MRQTTFHGWKLLAVLWFVLIGAYLAGYGYDHFGSYAPVFYLIAGLCVGGSVLLVCMKPPVRRPAKSQVAAVTL